MKKLIRKLFWAVGYDLQRVSNSSGSARLTYELAHLSKPTAMLDVGANAGQSALEFLSYLPACKVLSFEPLSKAHAIALGISKNHENWEVYPRAAVGETDGEIYIHISHNSVSSSLFEVKTLHSDSAPESVVIGKEKTPIIRLDHAIQNRNDLGARYYLKIDTQGFELSVLNGAKGILDKIVAIQIELSWGELYASQALANEVIQWLLDHGFQPYGFSPGLRDLKSKVLLQMDGFFLRN